MGGMKSRGVEGWVQIKVEIEGCDEDEGENRRKVLKKVED